MMFLIIIFCILILYLDTRKKYETIKYNIDDGTNSNKIFKNVS